MYTFNGRGEYFMVYAPGIFTLQARTTNAIKEDGNISEATVFSAFVAQDHRNSSGRVSNIQKLANIVETAKIYCQ